MNNHIQSRDFNHEDDKIDFNDLFQKIISKWYLFLIFVIIGVSGAYLYSKVEKTQYEVETTLLIQNQESKYGIGSVFDSEIFNPQNVNITNQIGILNSYTLNKEALENLDWDVFYYKKQLFSKTDLYTNSPFSVLLDESNTNLAGIPIYIKPISENKFIISIDEEAVIDGTKKTIILEKRCEFGVPIKEKYFNFIINKKPQVEFSPESEYFFVVADKNSLASLYRSKLSITLVDEKSDLIRLKLVGDQAAREVDYLNELTKVYIEFDLDKKNRKSDNTVHFIDMQLSGVIDSLQTANNNFTDFRSKNQIIDLSQEGMNVVERLEKLESERSMATLRYEYFNNLLEYLDNATEIEQIVVPSVVGITDPSLNATVTRLSELYARRSVLSLTVTDKNPALISTEKEIAYTKQILEENLRNLINNTSLELKNFESRERELNRQLARLPQTEQNLVNIKRDFDINNELYTFLLQKRAESAIAKASNISDAQILDLASIETAVPLRLNKKVLLVIGLLIGFGIPLLIILGMEYLNNTISNKQEVEKYSRFSVLGGISHNRNKIEMPVLKLPKSPITESFRSLRTNLNYKLSENDKKVIAIHSSIKGEGKTFISVNLALALALSNKKVLLVGCDLRKPRLHKIFNCRNTSGLSSYLIHKDEFDKILIKSELENLSLVLSGPVPPNPAELLESTRFEQFLTKAKDRFEYIVIDNAPSFMVTDGILVSKKADLNLFVIRINKSYKDHLKIINSWGNNGMANKIGLVINDIRSDKFGIYNTYQEVYQ